MTDQTPMRNIFAADIGGTHARFAIASLDDNKEVELGETMTLNAAVRLAPPSHRHCRNYSALSGDCSTPSTARKLVAFNLPR